MNRYFLEVSYLGTGFHGSQLQGELPTVQYALNKALSVLLKQEVSTLGASRTDEGVHALQNFFHFDYATPLDGSVIYRLNALLPQGISALNIYRATDMEFNARFAATHRSYRYRIYRKKNPFSYQRAHYYPYPVSIEKLEALALQIANYQDFESFSKRNTQSKTSLCHILVSRWEKHGKELHYVVKANRFLRGMVRGLVATQLHLARTTQVKTLDEIFTAKDCRAAWFDVPGHGLYLEEIAYPEGALVRL